MNKKHLDSSSRYMYDIDVGICWRRRETVPRTNLLEGVLEMGEGLSRDKLSG